MSSDAIIKGLKQGNALEMASLEEVKEGMSSVIDGLLKECYNRSDALSDLMEKVQLNERAATPTAATVPPCKQALLKEIIEDAIKDCDAAQTRYFKKLFKKFNQAKAQHEDELKILNEAAGYENVRLADFGERTESLRNLSRQFTGFPLNPQIDSEIRREGVGSRYYSAWCAAETARIEARHEERTTEATNGYRVLERALIARLRTLWSIADLADIRLDSTTDVKIQCENWKEKCSQ